MIAHKCFQIPSVPEREWPPRVVLDYCRIRMGRNVRCLYSADIVSMYLPVEDVHMRAFKRHYFNSRAKVMVVCAYGRFVTTSLEPSIVMLAECRPVKDV